MTHTSSDSHAVLISELAALREAARNAEKALVEANLMALAEMDVRMNRIIESALTRLRESLKGAGDER